MNIFIAVMRDKNTRISAIKASSAFALAESLMALALFAIAAYFICESCYNMLRPLDMGAKDCLRENTVERAVAAICAVSNYDELDDGIDVESMDGDTYKVYGEAEPTAILDLFKLSVRISGHGSDVSRELFVMRPSWYQDSSERPDLLRDRTDYLEDLRISEDFNK